MTIQHNLLHFLGPTVIWYIHNLTDPPKLTNMEAGLGCRFISGLFGSNSPPAPVWGSSNDLNLLSKALAADLSISSSVAPEGSSEASCALQATIIHLQKAGRIPADVEKVKGLSDSQREALGFELKTLDPATSIQHLGKPNFVNQNIAKVLAILRFVARYQELKTGSKRPIFRVGVVTLTADGFKKHFRAQTFKAADGTTTDTVWLYRWCVMDGNGAYEEYWRAFSGHVVEQQANTNVPMADAPVPAPAPAPTPVHQPASATVPKPTRKPRHTAYLMFEHDHLSDDELFASRPEFIQGDAIIRLARNYSNTDIFKRINAATPGGIKNVCVITKRLTHAIEAAAETSGRSVLEIRQEIVNAKNANGIEHSAVVDTSRYASSE